MLIFSLGASQEGQWFKLETSHFTVYFKGKEAAFPQKVARQAELDYSRLLREWSYQPDSRSEQTKYEIYLFYDRRDYLEATGRPEWSQSAASLGASRRIAGRQDSKTFLKSELSHELAHIFFREMIGLSGQPLPAWIDEGVALFAEPGDKGRFKKVVRQAIQRERVIPLNQLNLIHKPHDLDREKLLIFYAQSWSLADFFIMNFGKDRFLEFCRSMARNENLDFALRKLSSGSFPTATDIEMSWKKSSRKR